MSIAIEDFTAERWAHLEKIAERKTYWPRPFNPEHFFTNVQNLMRLGMAQAWGNEERNAYLVALFTNNIFSGDLTGLVLSWKSLDPKISRELIKEFEVEAKNRGCVAVYSSSFRSFRAESMARLYRRLGFEPHEVGFIKML